MPSARHSVLKNSVVYLVANILNAAIPFALLPILTRHLSPDEYGEIAMFQVLLGLLGSFIGLESFGAAAIKHFDKNIGDDELSQFIGASLQIILISSVVPLVLFVACHDSLSSLLKIRSTYIFYAVLTAIAAASIQLRLTQWQVRKKAKQFGLTQVMQSAVNMTASILLVVVFRMGADGRIIAQILTALIFSIVAIISLKADGLLHFLTWNPKYLREALKFGVPLLPHSIGIFLLSSIDRLLVAQKIGLDAAGVYMVGVQMSLGMNLIFTSMNNAFAPWLFMKLSDNEHAEKVLIVKYTYLFYIVVLALALLSFAIGPWVVAFVAGPAYERTKQIIGWLVLGQCFLGMQLSVVNYIYYSKKTAFLSLSSIVTGALNVVLMLMLMPRFGIEGAAAAFAISMGIRFLTMWVVALRTHPMPWFAAFSRGVEC